MESKQRITVRFADSKDLDWCLKHDWERRYATKELIRSKIESREVIVAELKKKNVGYLRLEYLWLKIPYISLILVVEKYRQRGIARAMLRFLERSLRSRGHRILISSSQTDAPIPAQAWHRAMGFEECGILSGINEGGVGEVFFRKRL